ncbi:TetR/AcrR family transcriptional regulator [Sphingomonas sp. H39-1-10]|uniref:TetR/AcrR family transcriptional regulator n=1 Tax=Sphingomonas pollutisoli TaxID=3030829 RepID=UPI0023B89AA5|nr:TetR/AcrR family transcriptional regulator [Sphingomonas pollutisoli]MDF0491452.1 TetR/AcrR family transcriptional regulator [Sphingomonas pollutisoli]
MRKVGSATSKRTADGLRQKPSRERVIAVARRYFLAKGVAGTSLSAIAIEVGGSKETLWKHFPSKDSLFICVAAEMTVEWQRQIDNAFQVGNESHDRLTWYLAELCQIFRRKDVALGLRLLVAEYDRVPAVAQFLIEHVVNPILRDLHAAMSNPGSLAPTELDEQVRSVFNDLSGVIATAILPCLDQGARGGALPGANARRTEE